MPQEYFHEFFSYNNMWISAVDRSFSKALQSQFFWIIFQSLFWRQSGLLYDLLVPSAQPTLFWQRNPKYLDDDFLWKFGKCLTVNILPNKMSFWYCFAILISWPHSLMILILIIVTVMMMFTLSKNCWHKSARWHVFVFFPWQILNTFHTYNKYNNFIYTVHQD